MLGQQTRSPSAQLLVLAVLTGRLDDLDPGVRSFASQLLLGKAFDVTVVPAYVWSYGLHALEALFMLPVIV